MAFDVGPADQFGWGGVTLDTKPDAVSVPIVRLDDALNGESISLLKIDIEGADYWALLGAERLLRSGTVRHVWWEENATRMEPLGIVPGEGVKFVRACGYKVTQYGDNWHGVK